MKDESFPPQSEFSTPDRNSKDAINANSVSEEPMFSHLSEEETGLFLHCALLLSRAQSTEEMGRLESRLLKKAGRGRRRRFAVDPEGPLNRQVS